MFTSTIAHVYFKRVHIALWSLCQEDYYLFLQEKYKLDKNVIKTLHQQAIIESNGKYKSCSLFRNGCPKFLEQLECAPFEFETRHIQESFADHPDYVYVIQAAFGMCYTSSVTGGSKNNQTMTSFYFNFAELPVFGQTVHCFTVNNEICSECIHFYKSFDMNDFFYKYCNKKKILENRHKNDCREKVRRRLNFDL
ncbi:phosphohydrolase [Pieris rapae granulovirus Wuhan]|uniref:Phosphohydrolase n=1 Tax=Pieris rapae granulovirus Wuhan TaxID=2848030 RepID=D2J4J9_9BBAC|nr:phosphohydrolase [Betabaculovirus arrapae]ACZ63518.1 phosphohydrolase [Betabaculovirus arrapae]ADO85458.1 unknown [Pieris rapae granulovirus]UOS85706.1 phosphohydrolase [Pieris rapae granulovirus]